VKDFFEYFAVNIFNFLEVKPINEDPLNCNMKNRFSAQDDVDCSFINSTFMILVNIAVLGVIKLILIQLVKGDSRKRVAPQNPNDSQIVDLKDSNRARVVDPAKESKPKESTIQKVNKYFNLAFYVYFFNSLLMDVVMAAFVNLFFMGYSGFIAIFHHLLSFVALVLFLGLVYKTLRIMIDLEIKRRDKVEGTHVKTKFK
jgi:hypothetical protein